MKLHNYMEDIVSNNLEIIMEREEMCKCEKCRLDVMALALNRLPPKYVVTHKGGIYTRLEELELQFRADVIKEIVKAIEVVKKNPQH
ncbi:MAG: competence protein ComFB [Candidatus Omnitrophica bacterium 4484_70.1]|nr:MAG: competence protein ComFB [Candidatus Omnitrophica bacterium 4484_70.1]